MAATTSVVQSEGHAAIADVKEKKNVKPTSSEKPTKHYQQHISTKSEVADKPNQDAGKDKDSSDRGWSRVKSKSEKHENRFNHHGPFHEGGERFRGYSGRRKPPYRGFPRKMGRSRVSAPSGTVTNAEVNGSAVDSHSSGDSADSDAKKSDSENRSKPEYVAAPMPKTNAWSKPTTGSTSTNSVAEKTDGVKLPVNSDPEPLAKKPTSEKKLPSSKTSRLPAKNAWGKTPKVESEKEELKSKSSGITQGVLLFQFSLPSIVKHCT